MLQATTIKTIEATTSQQVVEAITEAIDSAVPIVDYGVAHEELGEAPPEPHTRLRQRGGVIEHDIPQMMVRVAAGCTIGDLHRALASAGQFLAIDADDDMTVGEVLAQNVNGPLQIGFGPTRELVQRLILVDGLGRTHTLARDDTGPPAHPGLMNAVIGGLGELGVITEATLRVHAMPPGTLGVDLSLDNPQRIDDLLPKWMATDAKPAWLMLTKEDHRYVCRFAFFGSSGTCMLKLRSLEALLQGTMGVRTIGTGSDTFERDRLRRGTRGAWRRVVPAMVEVVVPNDSSGFICRALAEHPRTDPDRQVEAFPAQGTVFVGGPLNPDATRRLDEQIAHVIQPVGGYRVWHRTPIGAEDLPVCAPMPDDYAARCRRKAELDPHGILNPGRFLRTDAEGSDGSA